MLTDAQIDRKEPDASARKEAKSIVHAMKHGVDMSDVLVISEQTRQLLKAFCDDAPEDAFRVRNALNYRERVRAYVDRLLAGEEIGPETDDAETEEDIKADLAACAIAEADRRPVQGAEESAIS